MTAFPCSAAVTHHPLSHLPDAIGVHHFQPRRVEAAFKTAPHEGLEQAIVQRIPRSSCSSTVRLGQSIKRAISSVSA